ncbi:MAG: hypothetical protein ABI413_01150 [Ktedonobacteraceae bacterium]
MRFSPDPRAQAETHQQHRKRTNKRINAHELLCRLVEHATVKNIVS